MLSIYAHSTLDMQSKAASIMDEIVTPIAVDMSQLHPIRKSDFLMPPYMDELNRNIVFRRYLCVPGEARTLNLLIRSQALYPLSYGDVFGIIHEDFFPCLSDELQGRIDPFILQDNHMDIKSFGDTRYQ